MSKNNCIVYFHIATMGHYQDIVDEIFDSMIDSGLINYADEILLSIVGQGEILHPEFKNIQLARFNNIEIGEFFTLNKIKIFSDSVEDNYKILYIHTKGVSTPDNQCITDWRNYMTYFNIRRYEICLRELLEYDTCGVDLVNEPCKHYSGNFWWANSLFIKKLPRIDEICNINSKYILTLRHNAEFWICMSEGKYKSLHNTNINVYERHLHRYNTNNYVESNS
jgi:hypothetical protein